jgi:hypothetical protein
MPVSEALKTLMGAGKRQVSAYNAQRAESNRWASARTFADLGELTAQFCLGELAICPGHYGPRAAETESIADSLAAANRNGFLTDDSQPGELGTIAPFHKQKAFALGFADPGLVERLGERVEGTDLVMYAAPMRRWRRTQVCDEIITRDEQYIYSGVGSLPSLRDIRSGISFGGMCHPDAVDAVAQCWAVLIHDTRWGDHDDLWEILRTLRWGGAERRNADS